MEVGDEKEVRAAGIELELTPFQEELISWEWLKWTEICTEFP